MLYIVELVNIPYNCFKIINNLTHLFVEYLIF